MDDAELHGRIGKDAPDSIREAFQAIHAAYHNVFHTAVLQVRKHLQPEVCPLALGYVHTELFLMPVLVDTQYIVDGTGNGTPTVVFHLVVDGIKPANGIDRLQ